MSQHIPSIRMANHMKTRGVQILLSIALVVPALIVPLMLRSGLSDRQIFQQTDTVQLLASGLIVCVCTNLVFAGLLAVSAILAMGSTASNRRNWMVTSTSFETIAAGLGAVSLLFMTGCVVYIGSQL